MEGEGLSVMEDNMTQTTNLSTAPTTAQEVRDLLRQMALAGQLKEAVRGPYQSETEGHLVGAVFRADERDRGLSPMDRGSPDCWWVRLPDDPIYGSQAAEIPEEAWEDLLNQE